MIPLKTIYYHLAAFLILIAGVSCNEPQDLGASFFPDESFQVTLVDSLSLLSASVLYDSIPTRNTGRLLVGYHEDEKLGKIKAMPFFQLGFVDGATYNLDPNFSIYDSITLVLHYDGYSLYDTNQIQTLYVHEVQETIEIPSEDTTLYNNTAFRFNQIPLGQRSFLARPGRQGTLEIKLSDRLGKAIFDLAINDASALATEQDFLEYFKGLVLVPDRRASGAVLGFRPNASLKLYYTNDETLPAKQESLIFTMSDDLYFNQLQSDRQQSVLSNLIDFENPVYSTSTNQETFIQSGIGIATRIEVPYLRNMLELNDDFIISEAILQFSPTHYQNNTNTPLPSTLTAYWVDRHNQPLGSTFSAYLQQDKTFNRDIYYQMDITNFINTQLDITENNKNALLLIPSSGFNNSLQTLSIGDQRHKNEMKLILKLITL